MKKFINVNKNNSLEDFFEKSKNKEFFNKKEPKVSLKSPTSSKMKAGRPPRPVEHDKTVEESIQYREDESDKERLARFNKLHPVTNSDLSQEPEFYDKNGNLVTSKAVNPIKRYKHVKRDQDRAFDRYTQDVGDPEEDRRRRAAMFPVAGEVKYPCKNCGKLTPEADMYKGECIDCIFPNHFDREVDDTRDGELGVTEKERGLKGLGVDMVDENTNKVADLPISKILERAIDRGLSGKELEVLIKSLKYKV